jgi:hypothetical protein
VCLLLALVAACPGSDDDCGVRLVALNYSSGQEMWSWPYANSTQYIETFWLLAAPSNNQGLFFIQRRQEPAAAAAGST